MLYYFLFYLAYYTFIASLLSSDRRLKLVSLVLSFLGLFFLVPVPEVWDVYWHPISRDAVILVNLSIFLAKTLSFYTRIFTVWGIECSLFQLAWVGLVLYVVKKSYQFSSKSGVFVFNLVGFVSFFLLFAFLDVTTFNRFFLIGLGASYFMLAGVGLSTLAFFWGGGSQSLFVGSLLFFLYFCNFSSSTLSFIRQYLV